MGGGGGQYGEGSFGQNSGPAVRGGKRQDRTGWSLLMDPILCHFHSIRITDTQQRISYSFFGPHPSASKAINEESLEGVSLALVVEASKLHFNMKLRSVRKHQGSRGSSVSIVTGLRVGRTGFDYR
jgi:hypothetical protein